MMMILVILLSLMLSQDSVLVEILILEVLLELVESVTWHWSSAPEVDPALVWRTARDWSCCQESSSWREEVCWRRYCFHPAPDFQSRLVWDQGVSSAQVSWSVWPGEENLVQEEDAAQVWSLEW